MRITDLSGSLSTSDFSSEKIGSKTAGLFRARQIIENAAENIPLLRDRVAFPAIYEIIGADFFTEFIQRNDLSYLLARQYASAGQADNRYAEILAAFSAGTLPKSVLDRLKELLAQIGTQPLVVRSSSLLEDSYETSMAGKYTSVFCPNQSTLAKNLSALSEAVIRVYASVFKPEAVIFRRQRGISPDQERMAILIQPLQGSRHKNYFLPVISGVALSSNPFRWTKRIRRDEGMLRMVWGLGTRAVQPIADDYARLIALSHPNLRPEQGVDEVRHHSQRWVDLINLATNQFETVQSGTVLAADYAPLPYIASYCEGYEVRSITSENEILDPDSLVITLDGLLTQTALIPVMKALLSTLKEGFGSEINIEFTVEILPAHPAAEIKVNLLQCRPFGRSESSAGFHFPEDVPLSEILFSGTEMVPHGQVSDVRTIVYVDPDMYRQLPSIDTKAVLKQIISELNQSLKDESFILMGPGRWGSTNIDLGISVTFADIYNAKMLVELALTEGEITPQFSYGTHFYLDLVESGIYPLPLNPQNKDAIFQTGFFMDAPNQLSELLPAYAAYAPFIKVIDVPQITNDKYLQVVMDAIQDKAIGYLAHPNRE